MAALSWNEIVERGKQHNKTVICEVGKQGKCRLFKIKCNICGYETFLRTNKFLSCAKCANANTKKSNTEEFINKSMLIHEDKYDYSLVKYINCETKVKIICNTCNEIFDQKPTGHLSGNGCYNCAIRNKKSNTEEFIIKAEQTHSDKYNYSLVKYISNKIKIKIICNKCNNIFDQKPQSHLSGSGCPKCNIDSRKLTIEELTSKAKQIHGDKYNYSLVEYINDKIKIKIICNKCNEMFEQTPNSHLSGCGCKICYFNEMRFSKDAFIIKAKQIHGDKYNYSLVEYSSNKIKIKIICNKCNNIFDQYPKSHLSGCGCPKCNIRKKSNTEDFIIKAEQVHGDKYNYSLVEYTGVMNNVKIICNKCNEMFEQTPNRHLSGSGCPKCNESKGENKIAKYLSDKNIRYTKNKIFKTLKDKSYLKPDFYLDDLILLIEYDGHGHYIPSFGSTPEEKQKNLENTQRRDKIKDEWAKANNIPLLRIPYWDFDRIEELIDAFILQHTREKETKQLVLEM